jgi:hypothetical protein
VILATYVCSSLRCGGFGGEMSIFCLKSPSKLSSNKLVFPANKLDIIDEDEAADAALKDDAENEEEDDDENEEEEEDEDEDDCTTFEELNALDPVDDSLFSTVDA